MAKRACHTREVVITHGSFSRGVEVMAMAHLPKSKTLLIRRLVLCIVPALIAGGLAAPPSRAAEPTIVLLPEATVTGDHIEFGELVDWQQSDRALQQRLWTITIGKSPWPGQSRRIHVGYIKVRLRQADVDLKGLSISAPTSRILVERAAGNRPQAVQVMKLRDALQTYLQDRGVRAEVTAVNGGFFETFGGGTDLAVYDWCPASAGAGSSRPGTLACGGSGPLGGFLPAGTYEFLVGPDDVPQRAVWIRADLVPLVRGAVATQDIRYRESIVSEAVASRWVRAAGAGVLEPEQVIGLQAARHIRAGEIITDNMVQQPVLVLPGQPVVIRCTAGKVVVEVAGEALEEGSAGEMIKVRNRRSGSVVEALVRSPQLVEVCGL